MVIPGQARADLDYVLVGRQAALARDFAARGRELFEALKRLKALALATPCPLPAACAGPGKSPVPGPHDVWSGLFPGFRVPARGDPRLPADVRLFLRRRLPLRALVLGLRRRGGVASWRAEGQLAGGPSPVPLRTVGRPWLRSRACRRQRPPPTAFLPPRRARLRRSRARPKWTTRISSSLSCSRC